MTDDERQEPIGQAWARRRAHGERVADIAADARCSPVTVYRATAPYGPFLQPQQARRYFDVDPRIDGWVQRRRDQESVAAIARADHVDPREVREATRAHGPYPRARAYNQIDVTPQTLDLWVTARRAGLTIEAIARSAGVSTFIVSQATAPHGPFHPAPRRDGLLGINAVGELLGVTSSTLVYWRSTGFLPEATAQTDRGHDLWAADDILTWADQVGLPTCPTCGARPKDLPRHQRMRHPKRKRRR